MILDGGMGTMIQSYYLEEEDFRGNLFFLAYYLCAVLCNVASTEVSQLV